MNLVGGMGTDPNLAVPVGARLCDRLLFDKYAATANSTSNLKSALLLPPPLSKADGQDGEAPEEQSSKKAGAIAWKDASPAPREHVLE